MSPRSSSTPLLLIALWAGLLITFMTVRPSPSSPAFWLFIGTALLCGGLYMVMSYRDSSCEERETLTWRRQVEELVDIQDYTDDGHLPEYLDDVERRKVIEELRQMSPGSRSLRRALEVVSPELVDDK